MLVLNFDSSKEPKSETLDECFTTYKYNMEEIYLNGISSPSEGFTEEINFKVYFEEYGKLLSEIGLPTSRSKSATTINILQQIVPQTKQLTQQELRELTESTNPSVYTECGEYFVQNTLSKLQNPEPSASKPAEVPKEKPEAPKKRLLNRNDDERCYLSRQGIDIDCAEHQGRKVLVPNKNFLLTFRIHEPFHRSADRADRGADKASSFTQEIRVLDRQTLADFRDKIVCEVDYQDDRGDLSETPDDFTDQIRRNSSYSAMFYFSNTFYIDTCRNDFEDYSITVKEWFKQKNMPMGDTVPMQDMKIKDLKLRLGYPYLFQHQGGCEHLIVISGARFVGVGDSLCLEDYPMITKITQRNLKYCMTCSKRQARWIVRGSDRMIHDPSLMCVECFKSFHYVDGKKIGQFKAYPFWQQANLF